MNDFTEHRVRVPAGDLDDLGFRLAHTRWPDELPGVGWDYGIPLDRVRSLVSRWQHLDWRALENELNLLPGYLTEIDGQRIHFFHLRSDNPSAYPLILTHGWPGSVIEFLRLAPLLTADFHLVLPSIPGFGFSGPTTATGWGQQRVAQAWATLMDRLGYRHYGAQGGDWGSGISRLLAAAAPTAVDRVHVNYLPTAGPADGLTGEDLRRLEKTQALARNRHPHQLLFAQGPQTIAYALTDSPAGLLAFLADKFTAWSDPATAPDDDTILADVALYWLTRTAGSSARLIRESGLGGPIRTPVPLGVAVLPYDIVQSIRPLAERAYDIQRWTEYPRGGHFAAMEVPELLAGDLREFFLS
jgi:pimeloyl-ACP methyl ester carboxylesterase